MFKKAERLNRTKFTEYFKIGRRYHSNNFTLVFSPTLFRAVAVVVGKKVSKSAVERNTLRRQVYGIVRTFLDNGAVTTGIYIIISKPSARGFTSKAIDSEVTSLLATAIKPR